MVVSLDSPQAGTEPRAPAESSAGSVLATTKLHIPTLRPRAVRRPHLVSVLAAGAEAKLTLVDALPGSGKTSLLSDWYADPGEPRRFAWLSLDRADNDPARFFDGLIAAAQTIHPELGLAARRALRLPGIQPVDVVALLINELAALTEPVVVVLDDYHAIENPEIHAAVEQLVERIPPTVQLVIATRSDPPLPLSRLRGRGHLTELRAADLRFTRAESALFLNDVLHLDLSQAEIEKLHERTEGWAAGLQLAGLSLRGRADRQRFIDSFAGDDQQIVDYLGFEVLARQSPRVRDFLLRSSILGRLSGPLCAAVTGVDDAARLLLALERENLFVVPLDSRREWYRLHSLFAEMLRHELMRSSPQTMSVLHQRACAWYRDRAAVHEAIEHAMAAGEHQAAIELISAHWYEFLQRGRQETVRAWIDRLPSELVGASTELCLTKAWLGVNAGRLDEVDRWIEAASQAAAGWPDDDGLPPLASGVASLRAIHRYMEGDVGAAVAAGRHALALEHGREASPWRPVGCPVLGLSLHWQGRSDDAARTLSESVVLARSDGNHLAVMHASGALAAISYRRGDCADAERYAAEASRIAEERELDEHWARSLSLAVSAQLLALRGELRRRRAARPPGRRAGAARRRLDRDRLLAAGPGSRVRSTGAPGGGAGAA